MYRIFFLLIFGLSALQSHAQFGVQVGGAITATKFTQSGTEVDQSWNFRYNAGVLYRIRQLGGLKKVDLQPTLQYIVKGSTDDDVSNRMPLAGIGEIVNRLRYVQLSAPVILRLNEQGLRNITFNIGVGPYAARLVSAKSIAVPLYGKPGSSPSTDLQVGTNSQDDIKPLDLGLTLYVSAKLYHVSAGVSYDYGLLNVSPKANVTAYNRSFSIFFGYIF